MRQVRRGARPAIIALPNAGLYSAKLDFWTILARSPAWRRAYITVLPQDASPRPPGRPSENSESPVLIGIQAPFARRLGYRLPQASRLLGLLRLREQPIPGGLPRPGLGNRPAPLVNIFKPDDIILAEVIPVLDLNELKGCIGRVL